MNTQTDSTKKDAPAALALAPCSLLSWEKRDDLCWRGFLAVEPETTLFLIEETPFEEFGFRLTGAIIPDREEPWKGHLSDLKFDAERRLKEWLTEVCAPLVRATCQCQDGQIRAVGRDNDEIIENCPDCTKANTKTSQPGP